MLGTSISQHCEAPTHTSESYGNQEHTLSKPLEGNVSDTAQSQTSVEVDVVLQQSSLDTFEIDSEVSSVYSEYDIDSSSGSISGLDVNESAEPLHTYDAEAGRNIWKSGSRKEERVAEHDTALQFSSTAPERTKYQEPYTHTDLCHSASRKSSKDRDLVTWDGPSDRSNPHNWPKSRQWTSMLLVSMFTFISPMASTMIAPALSTISKELNITSSVEEMFIMAIFLLAYAIGPFLWGPLSEVFGRVKVLQCANMIFLLFNTVCGFANTKTQMMAFRFLSGIGGSAPQAIGGGVLSDIFKADERGLGIAVYSLMPFISPAVAPIMGAYLTQYTTWRWVFWSTSIFDLFVQILCLLFLRETHPPAILAARAKRLREKTGNQNLHTKWQGPDHTMKKILMKALVRPFIMLGTQPALQAMALFRAYQYGLMYLALATFPMVFQGSYGMSQSTASLNYLSLGIGFIIGLQISGLLQDKIYTFCKHNRIDPSAPVFTQKTWLNLWAHWRNPAGDPQHTKALLPSYATAVPSHIITIPRKPLKRSQTTQSLRAKTDANDPSLGLPEFRLPLTLPFSLLIAVGLFMYGFTAQAKTHWILPNIGACLFAIGLIICFNCAQAYVVDTYTTYAASATGAAAFVRTMAGFSFPLFAPKMYDALGVGWGNGVLGFICLGLGAVLPVLLWRWGGWLRSKSTYCVG